MRSDESVGFFYDALSASLRSELSFHMGHLRDADRWGHGSLRTDSLGSDRRTALRAAARHGYYRAPSEATTRSTFVTVTTTMGHSSTSVTTRVSPRPLRRTAKRVRVGSPARATVANRLSLGLNHSKDTKGMNPAKGTKRGHLFSLFVESVLNPPYPTEQSQLSSVLTSSLWITFC
jgi:hypothetical protein